MTLTHTNIKELLFLFVIGIIFSKKNKARLSNEAKNIYLFIYFPNNAFELTLIIT